MATNKLRYLFLIYFFSFPVNADSVTLAVLEISKEGLGNLQEFLSGYVDYKKSVDEGVDSGVAGAKAIGSTAGAIIGGLIAKKVADEACNGIICTVVAAPVGALVGAKVGSSALSKTTEIVVVNDRLKSLVTLRNAEVDPLISNLELMLKYCVGQQDMSINQCREEDSKIREISQTIKEINYSYCLKAKAVVLEYNKDFNCS